MTEPDWKTRGHPTEPGIYAVMICWDIEEGMFPEFDTWEGSKFARYGDIVVAHAGPFPTPEFASDWAWENDMEA